MYLHLKLFSCTIELTGKTLRGPMRINPNWGQAGKELVEMDFPSGLTPVFLR